MAAAFHVPVYFDYLATFSRPCPAPSWPCASAATSSACSCWPCSPRWAAASCATAVPAAHPAGAHRPVYLPLITLATLLIALLHQRIATCR
jgi:hypothetical protein